MQAETGCDAVMVGRGAMGNPWLFRTLAALARGEPDPGPPTLAERHAVWRRHADLVLRVQRREDAGARAAQDPGLVLARPARRRRSAPARGRAQGSAVRCWTWARRFFTGLREPGDDARGR